MGGVGIAFGVVFRDREEGNVYMVLALLHMHNERKCPTNRACRMCIHAQLDGLEHTLLRCFSIIHDLYYIVSLLCHAGRINTNG